MKTTLMMLASLAIGTAAIAQDAPAPQTAPAATPDTSMPASTTDAAPATNTAAPDAAMPAPAAPAPDATATASATDTSNYPMCSRSVTDKCVQRHHR